MKELKIILLVLALGFGSSVPATTKFPCAYYPYTIKGGLQTTKAPQMNKLVALGVEGDYEYYLQYLRYKLDYKKDSNDGTKEVFLSPSCVLGATVITC